MFIISKAFVCYSIKNSKENIIKNTFNSGKIKKIIIIIIINFYIFAIKEYFYYNYQ